MEPILVLRLNKTFSDAARLASIAARKANKGPAQAEATETGLPKSKFDFVPGSHKELYDHYFAKKGGKSIVGTIIKGIAPHATQDEFESWSHDVYARMLDKKVMENFDPTKGNFGGTVYFTTRSVVVNALEKKSRDALHNSSSLVDHTDAPSAGTVSMETLDQGHSEEGRKEAKSAIHKLTNHLEKLASTATNTRDKNLIRCCKMHNYRV